MILTLRFARVVTILAVLALTSIVGTIALGTEERGNLESQLYADASDGQLDQFTLLEAGLIASGVDARVVLTAYVERLNSHLERIPSTSVQTNAKASQAASILRFLHRELLIGNYDETCTEITRLLDEGDFNCVSATLLYQYLCRTRGLAPVAVATSTHVRSRFLESDIADVETTCGQWFDLPGNSCQRQVAHPGEPTRRLSDVELVGKIYYNRGVSLLEQRHFAAAIGRLRIARHFDPQDASADENLLAAINNWALDECSHGRFERASALITKGLAANPDYAPFAANDLHIHQQWAVHLCAEQRFEKAFTVLERAHQRRPEVELFDRGRFAVSAQWRHALLKAEKRNELVEAAR